MGNYFNCVNFFFSMTYLLMEHGFDHFLTVGTAVPCVIYMMLHRHYPYCTVVRGTVVHTHTQRLWKMWICKIYFWTKYPGTVEDSTSTISTAYIYYIYCVHVHVMWMCAHDTSTLLVVFILSFRFIQIVPISIWQIFKSQWMFFFIVAGFL